MVHKYPRQKTRLVIVNGFYDDFADTKFSKATWRDTWNGALGQFDVKAAPGGAGGNALWLKGEIASVYPPTTDVTTQIGSSPYANRAYNYSYAVNSPFIWNCRAEFRLYIVQDQATTQSSAKLAHAAGFCIDGNVLWDTSTNHNRTCVYFSVANDLVGVAVNDENNQMAAFRVSGSEVAQTLAYDTWYDVRIEWRYNWYTEPRFMYIDVYLDNVKIIDNYAFGIDLNRNFLVVSTTKPSHHGVLGRCGPHLSCEKDAADVSAGTFVEAYYKDILITNDIRFIEYQLDDSIMIPGATVKCNAVAVLDDEMQLGKGSDIQFYFRETTSDNWNCFWRGIIQEVIRIQKKIVAVQAEGYISLFFAEKIDSLDVTGAPQLASYFIRQAVNTPDKDEFDTTTYFDTTTTTYNRFIRQTKKTDIFFEFTSLEQFFLFIDHGLNVHFENYRTNQLDIHLQWGSSRIISAEKKDVFFRQPNIIRVFGAGVYAEKELPLETVSSRARSIRTFNRYDLTTQTDVDEALDYYASLYREPVVILEVNMRANYSLKKGHVIRVTIPDKDIYNQEFIIAGIKLNHRKQMILSLIAVSPQLTLFIADINKRTDDNESQSYEEDTVAAAKQFNIEGIAKVLIYLEYEIEWGATIERSGRMITTDDMIDDLIALWNNESPPLADYIAVGNGTISAKFSDTALAAETDRNVITTRTKIENIGFCTPSDSNFPQSMYRAIELEADITLTNDITEVGLFTGSSGNTCKAREVFSAGGNGETITARIIIRVLPVHASATITLEGISRTIEWFANELGSRAKARPNISHLMHVGSPSFTVPNPYISDSSEFTGVTVIPALSTAGTFTKTKYLDRNLLKCEFVYTYDYATDKSAGADSLEVGIAAAYDNTYVGHWNFVLFRRRPEVISNKDGFSCKWILWIQLIRGDYGNIS